MSRYFPSLTNLPISFKNIENDGAGWSSLVARRAHNPKVEGSNPSPATKNKELKARYRK